MKGLTTKTLKYLCIFFNYPYRYFEQVYGHAVNILKYLHMLPKDLCSNLFQGITLHSATFNQCISEGDLGLLHIYYHKMLHL